MAPSHDLPIAQADEVVGQRVGRLREGGGEDTAGPTGVLGRLGLGPRGARASRTASARAVRSSSDGGAGSKSVASRITCQPRGAVKDSTCLAHRSYASGWASVARGPSTIVESA